MMRELDQLADDREMAALATALPAIERIAAKQQKLIIEAVRGAQNATTLTGEQATLLWASFMALESVVDGVRGLIRVHRSGLNRPVPPAMLGLRPTAGPEAV